MRKLLKSIRLSLVLIVLTGCTTLTLEEQQEVGETVNKTISTLKGDQSVILHFDVEYVDDEYPLEHEYDILINKTKNYQSLQMEDLGYQDYRYLMVDPITNIEYYYEYKPMQGGFDKSASDVEGYVFKKLSFGEYDILSITFSIEEIINMMNDQSITMEIIQDDREELEGLTLYRFNFNLDYFIEHNPSVLKGLYGDKIEGHLKDVKGLTQSITIGYNEQESLKYFAFEQLPVISKLESQYDNIKVEVYVNSTGAEAEANMIELEQSEHFPHDYESRYKYTEIEGAYLILDYIANEEEVRIPSQIDTLPVTQVNTNAFMNSSVKILYIPKTVTLIEDHQFTGATHLETIIVDENNEYYQSLNGLLYQLDEDKKILVYIPEANTDIMISNECSSINYNAFYGKTLTSITFENGFDLSENPNLNLENLTVTDIYVSDTQLSDFQAYFTEHYPNLVDQLTFREH